jgi:hypothetical protein
LPEPHFMFIVQHEQRRLIGTVQILLFFLNKQEQHYRQLPTFRKEHDSTNCIFFYLDKRIGTRQLWKSGRRSDLVSAELSSPRRQMEKTRRVIISVLLRFLGQWQVEWAIRYSTLVPQAFPEFTRFRSFVLLLDHHICFSLTKQTRMMTDDGLFQT